MMADPRLIETAGRIAARGRALGCDVATLRAILVERGSAPVSRAEVDALMAVHRAVRGADNDPEWDDLFVGAVADHLVGASGHPVRPRKRGLAASSGLTPVALASDAVAWVVDRLPRGARASDAERALLAYVSDARRGPAQALP
jgi:hypothetical protein